MSKRIYFTLAVMAAFGLIGMPDAKADDTDNWSGVYLGIGVGAGSLDLSARGRKTKDVMERQCTEVSEEGVCLEPDDLWYKIPDEWHEDGYGSGEDEDYDYSKNIHTSNDHWSIFGTVQIGIDKQIDQYLVIGAFADYDLYSDSGHSFSMPWIKPSRTFKHPGQGAPKTRPSYVSGSLSGDVELESVWSVGGRLGVLVTPEILLYAMGGYTQVQLDGSLTIVSDDDYGVEPLSVNLPDELRGYFIGVGSEFKLSDGMALKVAYRYSYFDGVSASASKNFVNYDVHSESSGWEHENTQSRNVSIVSGSELHAIRAALVFKLGGNDEEYQPLK